MNVVEDLTLFSASWGGYFARFGRDWLASIAALDPQPAKIIIATDRLLPLDQRFTQIEARQPYHWDAFNAAVEAADTEWVAGLALDDGLAPDAFANIIRSGDVEVSYALASNGALMRPKQDKWNNIMSEDWFPLSGYQIVRRDVWLRFPLRPVVWADWVQALEWKAAGVRVEFHERVKQHYRLHEGQHSNAKDYGMAKGNIELVKFMLANGGIRPGNEWPPFSARPFRPAVS